MLAQSFGAYGSLSSIGSTVQSALDSARFWFVGVSPTTWVVVVIAVIALVMWARR